MFRIVSRSIQMNRMISNRFNQPVFVQQIKNYSDKPTQTSDECEKSPEKLGGFAKAFNEMEHMINKPEEPVVETVPFKKLLRNSKFVDVRTLFSIQLKKNKNIFKNNFFHFQLGDPLNKIVSGRIVHTVDEDLYIDFGWKFNCVCRVPEKNGQ